MSKKQTYHSFVEDGQKHLQCKRCYEYQQVDMDTAKVTCSRCVVIIDLVKFPDTLPKHSVKKTSGRPPGWHFMNEYVDKDGNVFHKGKEQPKLKGTLPPTKVKPPKKRKKLSADQKLFKKAAEYKKRLKAKRGKK
tara:strand:- start:18 stop:422 length:405 start_codon:yes stop_codon:yes gene_type:complete